MRRLDLWAAACGGLCLLAGCGEKDPFSYQKVSGKVTYEDGSLIPVPAIQLTFSPLAKSDDPRKYPPAGIAEVNVATGEFSSVTSHLPGDGILRGKHKVMLETPGNEPLPENLVPPEYFDFARTPLEVDTANWSGELKVRKPAAPP